MIKIKDIADIRLGYAFRGKIEDSPQGTVRVIQPKDVSLFDVDTLTRISIEDIKTSGFLKKDDVLVTNRGSVKAFVFKGEDKIIASHGFFILTIKDKSILSDFVELYINSSSGQQSIKKVLEAMTIPALTRGLLENIEIPRLNLQTQKKLISIWQLQQKEIALTNQLIELKEKRFNQILKGALKNG